MQLYHCSALLLLSAEPPTQPIHKCKIHFSCQKIRFVENKTVPQKGTVAECKPFDKSSISGAARLLDLLQNPPSPRGFKRQSPSSALARAEQGRVLVGARAHTGKGTCHPQNSEGTQFLNLRLLPSCFLASPSHQ